MTESARDFDANGWMEIRDNPISKVGVFPYRGAMVDPTLDPNSIVMVYRSEDELSAPATIESFKLIPWVDDHTILGNGCADLTPSEEKGIDGVIGEDVYFRDGFLYGNLKVFSGSLTDSIVNGKTELSCGYRCEYVLEQGIFGDQKYDAVQKNIRGNHLASVEEGRMGPDVAVLDHLTFTIDSKDFTMAKPTISLDERLKALSPKQVVKLTAVLDKLDDDEKKVEDMDDDDDEKKVEDMDDDDDEKKVEDEDDDEKKVEDMDDDDEKKVEDNVHKEGEKLGEDEDKDDDEIHASTDAVDIKALQSDVRNLKQSRAGATRDVLRDIRRRSKLYAKVSEHVGAFDHDDMTTGQIARYACDKLDIPAPRGAAITAIEAYLMNRPARSAFASDHGIGVAPAADGSGVVDKYLTRKSA